MIDFKFSPITGTQVKEGTTETDYRVPAFAEREWLFNPWTGKQRSTEDLLVDPQGRDMCANASRHDPLPVLDKHIGDDFDEPHMLRPGPIVVGEPSATVIHHPKTGAEVMYVHADCLELKVYGTCTKDALLKLYNFVGGMMDNRVFG